MLPIIRRVNNMAKVELKTIVETYKGVPQSEPNCPKVEGPIECEDFGSIEVRVGRVKDVFLGISDDRLQLDITVEGCGWGITFPCYLTYDMGLGIRNTSVNFARGLHSLLKFFDVSNFKDLKGQYLRVEYSMGGAIHRFFHVMEDKSFSWDDYDADSKPKPKED